MQHDTPHPEIFLFVSRTQWALQHSIMASGVSGTVIRSRLDSTYPMDGRYPAMEFMDRPGISRATSKYLTWLRIKGAVWECHFVSFSNIQKHVTWKCYISAVLSWTTWFAALSVANTIATLNFCCQSPTSTTKVYDKTRFGSSPTQLLIQYEPTSPGFM